MSYKLCWGWQKPFNRRGDHDFICNNKGSKTIKTMFVFLYFSIFWGSGTRECSFICLSIMRNIMGLPFYSFSNNYFPLRDGDRNLLQRLKYAAWFMGSACQTVRPSPLVRFILPANEDASDNIPDDLCMSPVINRLITRKKSWYKKSKDEQSLTSISVWIRINETLLRVRNCPLYVRLKARKSPNTRSQLKLIRRKHSRAFSRTASNKILNQLQASQLFLPLRSNSSVLFDGRKDDRRQTPLCRDPGPCRRQRERSTD